MERIKCDNLIYLETIDRYYCKTKYNFVNSVKYCFACQKCKGCVNQDEGLCFSCADNPKFADRPTVSHYKPYHPACPFGYMYCVSDPAYIKTYDPEWYEELYDDLEPWEVTREDVSECYRYFHDERYDYCPHYDDEDK